MSSETTAILAIAAERFLSHRHTKARDVFGAIAHGADPRVPGHVVCIRNGQLFDVELPRPEIAQATEFIARLYRAEHVVGLEEQLDVTPSDDTSSLVATPGDIGVRLWACEAWLEKRSQVRVSERYFSFPREVQWVETELPRPVLDRYLFDYEAAFAPADLTDEQARVILEHKGCRVTDADLDRELDRFLDGIGAELARDFGPDAQPPFGPTSD